MRMDDVFFRAVQVGDKKEVEYLLALNPHQKTLNDWLQHVASLPDRTEILHLLLTRADATSDNSNAISVASYCGHLEAVKILTGVSKTDHPDCYALRFAAQMGHLEVVKLLEPLSTDHQKEGALLRACQNGHVDVARHLVSFGQHNDCVDVALWNGHADIIALFLSLGYPDKDNERAISHKTFLNAVEDGYYAAVRVALPLIDPLHNNSEALSVASKMGRRDIFELLYPVSDPKTSLDFLRSRPNIETKHTDLLTERMAVDESKKSLIKHLLTEKIGTKNGTKRKI